MNCYQKSRGTKTLIDVDFDIPEEGFFIIEEFIRSMREHGVYPYVINTKSGYHVLLKNENIGFNFHAEVVKANGIAQERFGKEHVEVVINKNAMVPVPGTLQAGHKVKFIEVKEK